LHISQLAMHYKGSKHIGVTQSGLLRAVSVLLPATQCLSCAACHPLHCQYHSLQHLDLKLTHFSDSADPRTQQKSRI